MSTEMCLESSSASIVMLAGTKPRSANKPFALRSICAGIANPSIESTALTASSSDKSVEVNSRLRLTPHELASLVDDKLFTKMLNVVLQRRQVLVHQVLPRRHLLQRIKQTEQMHFFARL